MTKSLTGTPLSVLDLAPYPQGKTIADAFRNTRDLARHAEACGYKRYWIAEHHNIDGVASSAAPLLIGYVAENTATIRVGSGGIMLPNHAPLVVAEQFGTLATLYPDRIDLGLGRAPGSDGLTARALRRNAGGHERDFAELIEELLYYFAPAEAGQRVRAIPGAGISVPVYILGSSLYSAELAARLGRPYAFAGHFAPAEMLRAFEIYRSAFRPSIALARPHVMVGVPVVAADTDERAEHLATTVYQTFLNIIRGSRTPVLPPVDSMDGVWTQAEEAMVRSMLGALVVGGHDTVRRDLQSLIDITGADELIVASNFYDHADRLRSYEIIAEAAGVKSAMPLASAYARCTPCTPKMKPEVHP